MRNTSRSASRSRSTFVSRTVRQHAAPARRSTKVETSPAAGAVPATTAVRSCRCKGFPASKRFVRAEQLPPAESCEKLPGRSIGRRGDLDPLRMDAGLRQLGQHSLQPLAPHEGDPAVVFTPQEGRPVVAHPRGELRVGGLYDRAVARDRDHGDPFGHRRRVVHRLLRFAAHLAAPCRDRMAVGCQRDVQHPYGTEDIREKIHFYLFFYVPFVPVKRTKGSSTATSFPPFHTKRWSQKCPQGTSAGIERRFLLSGHERLRCFAHPLRAFEPSFDLRPSPVQCGSWDRIDFNLILRPWV